MSLTVWMEMAFAGLGRCLDEKGPARIKGRAEVTCREREAARANAR